MHPYALISVSGCPVIGSIQYSSEHGDTAQTEGLLRLYTHGVCINIMLSCTHRSIHHHVAILAYI